MGGLQSSYMSVDEPPQSLDVSLEKLSPPRKVLPYDPRSPSSEITRTPILVEKTPDLQFDPRSPTPGVIRTPIYNFFKNIHIGKSPSPVTTTPDDSVINASTDVIPDPSLTLDSLCLGDAEDDVGLINFSMTSSGDSYESSPQPKPTITPDDVPKQTKPKQLFTNRRSSTGRSPLKVFNHETPTRQVQRRQMRKVNSNIKSCRLAENVASQDKENINSSY